MGAVYNEIDPAAAAWLRELIANNLIAPGDVDERSIKDVRADDYRGYDQVHCFAGIGIYSAALRRSGWEDDRPIGTASVPCQPFSAAGKGLGFDDPRHLWPDYLRLVDEALQQGQPWADTLIGEQVSSAGQWLDLVRLDLEDRRYAFGAADIPAAGFAQGAHIRQRFYWVADRHHAERWADVAGRHFGDWPQAGRVESYGEPGAGGAAGGVDHHHHHIGRNGCATVEQDRRRQPSSDGCTRRLADSSRDQCRARRDDRTRNWASGEPSGLRAAGRLGHHHHHHPRPSLGSWGPDERGAIRVEGPALGATGSLLGCDWLLCHDARIRPVESGAFPLAPSNPGRVGLLRGFGNALDLETAVNFISAYMEACGMRDVMAEYT